MKKLYLTLLITILIQNPLFANEKKDCSQINKLSPKFLTCKLGNITKGSKDLTLDSNNISEKKYISDWFKKKK